jgi:transposase-like protein
MSKMFSTLIQYKIGNTTANRQCYQCFVYGCKYTTNKKKRGFFAELCLKAIRLSVDGMNLRRIGKHLGLHHCTVSEWVKAYTSRLPDAPILEKVAIAEMDEFFTFNGEKKQNPPNHHR